VRKGEDIVSELNEEARKIVEAVRTIAGAFDGRDIGTLQAAHYQGPESSMIDQSGERVVGWESVREQLENRMNEFEYSRTTIDDAVVSFFGDIAVATYERRIDSRLHDIDFKFIGWVTDVFIRHQGLWLRVHHQASDRKR
jgi:ketosteroid isomerase-like protein